MKRKEVRGCIGGCVCLSVLLLWSATPALGQNPGDDCANRVTAVCNTPGVSVNTCADATPGAGLDPLNVNCTSGGGVLDSYIQFVATNATARIRTDLNSSETDSNYVVYQVAQPDDVPPGDPCDRSQWVEIGCSEDDNPPERPPYLGDITVGGLTVGDTYIIHAGTWGDGCFAGGGPYVYDVVCADGTVCGDGVVAGAEACDDGAALNGTGNGLCLVDCSAVQVCGDGVTDGSEFCDDGFTTDCGDCNADCTAAGSGSCGDGVVCSDNEECDGAADDACQVAGTCQADCQCPPPKVPTLPVWGLIGLGLMLFAGAAVVFGRRRTFTAPSGE